MDKNDLVTTPVCVPLGGFPRLTRLQGWRCRRYRSRRAQSCAKCVSWSCPNGSWVNWEPPATNNPNSECSLFTIVKWFFFLALDEGGCSSNIVFNQFTVIVGIKTKCIHLKKLFQFWRFILEDALLERSTLVNLCRPLSHKSKFSSPRRVQKVLWFNQ